MNRNEWKDYRERMKQLDESRERVRKFFALVFWGPMLILGIHSIYEVHFAPSKNVQEIHIDMTNTDENGNFRAEYIYDDGRIQPVSLPAESIAR